MESGDSAPARKVKSGVPPVPIKTYKWEDIRREKRRGKYPWTYLNKDLFIEDFKMDESAKKPVAEKKEENVMKAIKKETTPPKPEPNTDTKTDEIVSKNLPKIELPDTPENISKASEEESLEKMDVEEICDEKQKTESSVESLKKYSITIIDETRDLSEERETNVNKEIEILTASSDKIAFKDNLDQMEVDSKVDEEQISIDVSQISEELNRDKNTESEDTYTDNNVDQYLDKDDVSKISTAEVSVDDLPTEEPKDEPMLGPSPKSPEILVLTDNKRKRSSTSEITKSTLSLFQKMKNSKFKPPTFKIPKFKKLTFKKTKTDVKSKTKEEAKSTSKSRDSTLQRAKPESPVYIHIPLNPTPEQLEEEKLKESQNLTQEPRKKSSSKTPSPTSKKVEKQKSTSPKQKKSIDFESVTSRWKGFQTKPKKFSLSKKKDIKSTEKIPKISNTAQEKKQSKSKDSPVYIHIPLKPSPENEGQDQEPIVEREVSNENEQSFIKENENNEPQETPPVPYETEINGAFIQRPLPVQEKKETNIDFTDDKPIFFSAKPLRQMYKETVIDFTNDEPTENIQTPLRPMYKETVIGVSDDEPIQIKPLRAMYKETVIDFTDEEPKIPRQETAIDFSEEELKKMFGGSYPIKSKETIIDYTDNIESEEIIPEDTSAIIVDNEVVDSSATEKPEDITELLPKDEPMELIVIETQLSDESAIAISDVPVKEKTNIELPIEATKDESSEKKVNEETKVMAKDKKTKQTADETNKKVEKLKETTSKLGKDIKLLASKIKDSPAKAKKNNLFKKKNTKSSPESAKKQSPEKKSTLKREESPKYIYIPLKGPIENENFETRQEKSESDDMASTDTNMPKLQPEKIVEMIDTNESVLTEPTTKPDQEELNESTDTKAMELIDSDTGEPVNPLPKQETKLEANEKTGAKPKQNITKKSMLEMGKETTEKLSKDLKKLAFKLKELKKKSKKPQKPTKKIGKPGNKKLSPKFAKASELKKSPIQKRSDSLVEYIHIPLKGPLPESSEIPVQQDENSLEKTEPESNKNVAKDNADVKATKDELIKIQDSSAIDTSKFVLFKDKPAAAKKELPNITPSESTKEKTKTEPSSSPFNSLKKTKDLSRKTFNAVKKAVTSSKDKNVMKKQEIKTVVKRSPVETKKKKETEPIFIPLQDPSLQVLEDVKPDDGISQPSIDDSIQKEDEISKDLEDPNISLDNTSVDVSEILQDEIKDEIAIPEAISEEHHISKEDEEDGLKMTQIAIIACLKENAQPNEEIIIKSNLKTIDSPKMNKKVSFKEKSMSEEEDTVKMEEEEDTVKMEEEEEEDKDGGYEVIEVRSDPKAKILEFAQSISVDEEKSNLDGKIVKNTSLDEDYNKWSKNIDHEYEPINPPEHTSLATHSSVHAAAADLGQHKQGAAEPNGQLLPENRLLRIPLDNELVAQPDEDLALSQDESLSTQEQLTRLEDKYLSTPETGSRTEEINTSQIDSSALERLPLKKESRNKMKETLGQGEEQAHGSNIQQSFRNQADRLKTKIKGIKKPTFTIQYKPKFETPKFQRPKFQKPKFERPKFKKPNFQRPKFEAPKFTMPAMPKMPDRPKINFPSFSMPRPGRRSAEEQHRSTESSVGSRKNIFDFRTYPRIFDKTKKKKKLIATASVTDEVTTQDSQFATVPPKAQRKKGPVGARWVHRFTDIKFVDEDVKKSGQYGSEDSTDLRNRSDSLERRMEEDMRYREALDADEELRNYEKENRDIHIASAQHQELPARWSHGSFHRYNEDKLQNEDEEDNNSQQTNGQTKLEYDSQQNNFSERSSIGSSGSRHRQGVLEEIDSDQFFLRQKGISQDNIQVGLYLSSEIRDAFKTPVNTLQQLENIQLGYGSREYDLDASDLSLSKPRRPKRKHLKKTKRIKKTPHASKEKIQYDQDSINTEPEEYPRNYNSYKTYPPSRPKRAKKSKQTEKELDKEDTILTKSEEQLHHVSLNDPELEEINYQHQDPNSLMYENEVMKDIEQPEILIQSEQKETTIAHFGVDQREIDRFLEDTGMIEMPKPPTRRNKSIKSLNMSENDSIMGEFNKDKYIDDMLDEEIKVYRTEHEYVVPSLEEPPELPKRRSRSRSRTESQADDDRTSRGAESIVSECHEPSCVEDLRDSMGYAIIDKQRNRETQPAAPKRRRSTKSNRSNRSNRSNKSDTKFFTVPRNLNDLPPTRPNRNYSTLGPSRPPRKRSVPDVNTEEKENIEIDMSQYIEIDDDEHSRDLQSGDIINKMKGRPLPAPPRPPRKTRDSSREPLKDITHVDNISQDGEKEFVTTSPASEQEAVVEIEVSTQTDPLPNDFCCEEMVEEPTDRIVAPTRRRSRQESLSKDKTKDKSKERPQTPLQRSISPNAMIIERRVQTPTEFDEDETITHASILVRPVAEYPPDSYVSKRFAADIPQILQKTDILQQNVLDITTYLDKLDTPQEIEEKDQTIAETKDITKTSEDTAPYLEADFKIRLDETCETCESIDEDICSPELPLEQIPEIPTKPTRAKIQLVTTDEFEILPLKSPEKIPEIPQKPQRIKIPLIESAIESSKSEVEPAMESSKPEVDPSKSEIEPSKSEIQPQVIERIIERPVPFCVTPGPDTEVEVLKAQRLQVADLDVERLNVTELQAHKIMVSEIDGVTIKISELTSKSGSITVNGLEIPSGLIQEILDRLQPLTQVMQPPIREQVSTQTDEPEKSSEETQTVEKSASKEHIDPTDFVESEVKDSQKENKEAKTEMTIDVAQSTEDRAEHADTKEEGKVTVEDLMEPPSVVWSNPIPEKAPQCECEPTEVKESPPNSMEPERLVHTEPRSDHNQMMHGIPYSVTYHPHVPSVPSASFYMLHSHLHEQSEEDIPVHRHRRKHHRRLSQSSSEEDDRHIAHKKHTTRSDHSIPELTGQLARACTISIHRLIKQFLSYMSTHVGTPEDRRNMQITLVIFIIFIAALIILGFGGGKTIHHHHWEYFNPPTDT